VRNASIDCPSGSFPDLGVSSCWKCPEGYTRSIHAVDKDKACQKPDSTVVGGFLAATFQGRLCEKGSFYDPIRGGECYSCPAGYSRTATHIDAPNACYKAESFSYATRVKTTPWPHECASGSFFDPIGGCFTCPAGYARTAYSVQTSQACAKAVNDPKPATLVKKAQCQPGEIRDLMIKGEQDVSAGGGCWTCPVATDRTILPITGDHACERAPGVRFAAATRTAPMTCEPNEIFDPINSDNSNVAQALAAHNRDFPNDQMTAKSSGGTCWICPPGSKRSAAAVYGWEACVTAMNWQPAPYNHAGLFGLVNAEPVALRLVNERTLINAVIQGIQQSAAPGSLPADYARTIWNEIATRPQDSAILKMVVLSRVMNAARQPATATPDEIALRDELAYKVQEFKIYMAQDALDAYRAWNANQSWRTGQFKQSQLAALVDIGQVPPDYELITAEKITGSLVAAGASDVALHLSLTTKAVLERLFPHMFRTTFQPVKEATRTGVMVGKAIKDVGTGTRITTEAVKTGVGGVGASIASIGPQIIVTIAIEVLAEAIQQQIEIADAEPKLKANLATAINEPVDFARLSATTDGAEVAKGYWSMVMGGPAPRADGVKPASLPPRNLAAFQAAAQVALAQ
jgi:hypothetical protein